VIKCRSCNFETNSRSSFRGHIRKTEHKDSLLKPWKCKFCEIEIEEKTKRGIHTVLCKLNPNRKETIKKQHETKSKTPMSEKTKKKISESRKKFLRDSGKNPYSLSHSSHKSNPEKIVESEFIKRGIKGWIYNFPHGTYKYDFAFPDLKVDVEIDGRQHMTESRRAFDLKRDQWTISQGWKVLRIPAILIRNDLESTITTIKEFLGEENLETQKNLNPRDYGILTRKEKREIKKQRLLDLENEKIEDMKNRLLFSDINFSKFGWVDEASIILNISPQKVSNWMKRNLLSFYEEKCFRRKSVSRN
jgi:very-short-patch-repair endonuclease